MKKTLCHICKATLDEDDTYAKYRESLDYKQGIYPEWAYADGVKESLASHLVNFHRLPQGMIAAFGVGLALKEALHKR